jgi:hypothetical protein
MDEKKKRDSNSGAGGAQSGASQSRSDSAQSGTLQSGAAQSYVDETAKPPSIEDPLGDGFYRIHTSRVGFRTTELVENLSVAKVRKSQLSSAIHVDQDRYRARMRAEGRLLDPNGQVK